MRKDLVRYEADVAMERSLSTDLMATDIGRAFSSIPTFSVLATTPMSPPSA